MATSGTYTVTITAAEIVSAALRSLGVIDPDETPGTNESANAIEALNLLLYQLRGGMSNYSQSMRIWQHETAQLTLNSSAASYSLYSSSAAALNIQIPEEIIEATLYNSSSSAETILEPMDSREYYQISNKAESGTPTRYFYKRNLSEGTLYLNYIPTSTIASDYVLNITYRQPLEVIAASSNDFDMQPEWLRALKYLLARDIASEYPEVSDSTLIRIDRLAREALERAQSFEPYLESVFITYEGS